MARLISTDLTGLYHPVAKPVIQYGASAVGVDLNLPGLR